MAAKSEQADRRSRHLAQALIVMQPPLQIWFHPKPNKEFYCEGFVTRRLSDMARHLQNNGYYAHQRIEVRNAATDKVMGQTQLYDALRGVSNGRVSERA